MKRIQRGAREEPGSRLSVYPDVRVDCSNITLRQCDVDASGMVSQLAGVDIEYGPAPTAIATLFCSYLIAIGAGNYY